MKTLNVKGREGKVVGRVHILTAFFIGLILLFSSVQLGIHDDHDEDSRKKISEHSFIDINELYSWYRLGMNEGWNIDYSSINPNYTIDDSVNFSGAAIYNYRPPELDSEKDIIEYLSSIPINISDYKIEFLERYLRTIKIFNDELSIAIYTNGAIFAHYNISSISTLKKNITKSSAIKIAEDFLVNNLTGIPTSSVRRVSAIEWSWGQEAWRDYYYVHYYPTIDNNTCFSSVYEFRISLKINAYRSCVESLVYHWPELEKIGNLSEKNVKDPDTIIMNYVKDYNQNRSMVSTSNITSVYIAYFPTLGYPLEDALSGNSPYYIILPYLRLEWEEGSTSLSPLKTGKW